MAEIQNQEKKQNRKLLSTIGTAVGLIVIVVLIIGGAMLASKKWDPRWNPFRQKILNESYI